MNLQEYDENILMSVERELKRQIGRLDQPRTFAFHEMLTYHMGWTGERGEQFSTGKRIRPLLLLLVVAAAGHSWEEALPAAAAVEIVHNFSLIHDDIQDNSPERRGRPALWNKYGVPMAINAGDALFAISSVAVCDLSHDYPADIVVSASTILHKACLTLTQGQFLDISYQKNTDLSISDYWPMVEGKTAALIAACTRIGAVLGVANPDAVELYNAFGRDLGLAFQVQDDILGIWGDETITGKSAANDLLEGKNSLPVLYGLSRSGEFATRWIDSNIQPEEVERLAQLLRDEGALLFAENEATRLTNQALAALKQANTRGQAGDSLVELTHKLLDRRS